MSKQSLVIQMSCQNGNVFSQTRTMTVNNLPFGRKFSELTKKMTSTLSNTEAAFNLVTYVLDKNNTAGFSKVNCTSMLCDKLECAIRNVIHITCQRHNIVWDIGTVWATADAIWKTLRF